MRRRLLAGAVAVAAAGALVAAAVVRDGDSGAPPSGSGGTATAPADRFAVSPSGSEVPPELAAEAPYVLGDRLHRVGTPEPEPLSHPLQAPLLGQAAALAVPSRDGRYLAYHAWEDETPLLVVRDLRTGAEQVLARGAQTVAWGPNGQVAYFQADEARYEQARPFVGHVVVRESVDAPPRRWTAAADAYEVRAWAGSRLLVAVRLCLVCSDEGLEAGLYALDGPGEPAPLPLTDLSALSPDGRWAVGPHAESPGQDSPTPFVRLVELATGDVAHTLDLPAAARAAGVEVRSDAGGFFEGVWRGDEIVAHALADVEGSLVFLRVDDDRLVFSDVLRLAPDAFPARYGIALGRPTFFGAGTDRVAVRAAWELADGDYRVAVLVCDRTDRRCRAGSPRAVERWFALVESPSRP